MTTLGAVPNAAQLAEVLRRGGCPDDRAFDELLPDDLRNASEEYWSPLCVAVQAARWFEEFGVRRVVDIGSGPGKFCIAAALSGQCQFVGLEHRSRLVAIARSLACCFGVEERVSFLQGALHELRVPPADAYYLYNPFAENLFGPDGYLADDVELGPDRYSLDIAAARTLFGRAPVGTLVLTYNGFGGVMPPDYEHLRIERSLPCLLSLWRKSRAMEGVTLFTSRVRHLQGPDSQENEPNECVDRIEQR